MVPNCPLLHCPLPQIQRSQHYIELLLLLVYAQIDDDKSGFIDLQELNKALELVGIRIPGYELRDLVAAADREKDDRIDIEEFKDVRTHNYSFFATSAHLVALSVFIFVQVYVFNVPYCVTQVNTSRLNFSPGGWKAEFACRPFRVIQGRWFCYQSAARMRLLVITSNLGRIVHRF